MTMIYILTLVSTINLLMLLCIVSANVIFDL